MEVFWFLVLRVYVSRTRLGEILKAQCAKKPRIRTSSGNEVYHETHEMTPIFMWSFLGGVFLHCPTLM
jgi:hypothetical protein